MNNGANSRFAVVAGAFLVVGGMAAAAPPPRRPIGTEPPGRLAAPEVRGPFLSAPVAPVSYDVDLRAISTPRAFQGGMHGQPLRLPEGFLGLAPKPGPEDPVLQRAPAKIGIHALAPTNLLDFQGAIGDDPPDENGDVGPAYYVETTNFQVAFFNKADGSVVSNVNINTFWSNAGGTGACNNNHSGDPVALYDPIADRYIVTDFAWSDFDDGPYYECIAVSKTSDPITGGWWLYSMRADDDSNKFLHDYPKIGVWNNGYYMMADMFDIFPCPSPPPTYCDSFQFVRVWAIDRTPLLTGAPLVEAHFDVSGEFSMAPSNFKGAAPPAGRPNYFGVVNYDSSVDDIRLYRFNANFGTSTFSFTGPTAVTVPAWSAPSVAPPQLGSASNVLDTLGPRLMYQLQYRNIGGTESLWAVHTVDAGGGTNGVRWYQLNVTGDTIAAAPVQSGTFSPDSTHRWMPHLAADRFGNMAVGYSASSSSINPQVRVTGRLAGDAAGTLQAEATIVGSAAAFVDCTPTPPATTCGARWGDYSAMEVDPVDDCTFWYVGEYVLSNGQATTRIAALRFDSACNCDLQIVKTDTGSDPAVPGGNVTYHLIVTNNGPVGALNPVVNDALAYPFVSVAPPAGWTCPTAPSVGGTGLLSCTAASLASGASATIDVTVQAPNAITTMSDTASISSNSTDTNSANDSDGETTAVLSPADVTGTKVWSSSWGYFLFPGAPVTYTIVLSNAAATAQFDNPGDEFSDALPPQLTLVSASATSGTVTTVANVVHWNGSIPGLSSVTITINATINAGTSGQTVSNQGRIFNDGDGDGFNPPGDGDDDVRYTDDPGVAGENDPTEFQIATPIPVLTRGGILGLMVLLLALGAIVLVRRHTA